MKAMEILRIPRAWVIGFANPHSVHIYALLRNHFKDLENKRRGAKKEMKENAIFYDIIDMFWFMAILKKW
jgi:hypothetical protein